MANAISNNVIIVDTSAAFEGPLYIKKIKYVAGATTPSASIKKKDSSGQIIYEVDGTEDLAEDVSIVALSGAYVTVAGGSKLYLYLK